MRKYPTTRKTLLATSIALYRWPDFVQPLLIIGACSLTLLNPFNFACLSDISCVLAKSKASSRVCGLLRRSRLTSFNFPFSVNCNCTCISTSRHSPRNSQGTAACLNYATSGIIFITFFFFLGQLLKLVNIEKKMFPRFKILHRFLRGGLNIVLRRPLMHQIYPVLWVRHNTRILPFSFPFL